MSKKRTESIVANDLNSRYLSIIGEKNDARYFLKIAEYGNYLLSTDKIDYVYKDIEKEYRSQLKKYEKELRKFVKAFKKEGAVVVSSIEEASSNGLIKTPPEELETLKEKVGGTDLNHYWNDVSFLWNDYVWVMKYLQDRKESNKKIAKVYNKLTNKNGEWKLWSDHVKAEEAWQDFKNKRDISTWWAHFKVLMLAAGVCDPKTRQKYLTVGEELDDLYAWEFKQIQQGQTSNLILVKRDKYEEYIRRLHSYLIPRLGEEIKASTDSKFQCLATCGKSSKNFTKDPKTSPVENNILEYKDISYDIERGLLIIGEKKMENVPIKEKPYIMLEWLIRYEGKIVSYDILIEKMDLNSSKDGIKQVHNHRKHLRNKLSSQNILSKNEFDKLLVNTPSKGYKIIR